MGEINASEIMNSKIRFERVVLDHGQLSLIKGKDADMKTLSEKIVAASPWNHPENGVPLSNPRRRVERHTVGDLVLVLKESEKSGKDLAKIRKEYSGNIKYQREKNTPSAQIAIVEESKNRYLKKYGEELPVEEAVGYYIDSNTTRKYMLYKYYKPIPLPIDDPRYNEAMQRVGEYDKKLKAVGVDRGEPGNFIAVKDDSTESGWKIILVDTEMWNLN